MKFGKQLADDRHQGWEAYYIDYKKGKTIIKRECPQSDGSFNNEPFMNFLKEESEKVVKFYNEKLALLTQKNDEWAIHMKRLDEEKKHDAVNKLEAMKLRHDHRIYIDELSMFENYVFLNHVAWKKIVKKFDKCSKTNQGREFPMPAPLRAGSTVVGDLKEVVQKRLRRIKLKIMSIDETKALIDQTKDMNITGTAASETASTAFSDWEPGTPMRQLVSVSFTGPDRPGVSNALIRNAATHNADVVDIHQYTVQNNVTVIVVVSIDMTAVTRFIKDVAIAGRIHGHEVEFDIVDDDYVIVNPVQGGDRYVLTLLSPDKIASSALAEITQTLASRSINIETVKRLNQGKTLTAVEMLLQSRAVGQSDAAGLKSALVHIARAHNVDLAMQVDNVSRWAKRLVIFDMDSTLIQMEVIDEIAAAIGIKAEVAAITERAMNGEIDFDASLKERVGLLKGTPVEKLQEVADSIVYSIGAKELCQTLKALGFKMAVISGGFMYFAEKVKNYLGLDYAFANRLEVDRMTNTLTGRTVGPVVNGARKADLLNLLAMQEGITSDQVIAIGDGANDLPMLSEAGVGIAFNAKPAVQEAARYRLNQKDLRAVLYMLGLGDVQIAGLEDIGAQSKR